MAAHFSIRAVSSQKLGNRVDEYEDAFAVEGTDGYGFRSGLDNVRRTNKSCQIAIADGATTSSYSAEWAQALVQAFATQQFHPTLRSFWSGVKDIQPEWWRQVSVHELPWHAQQKIRNGAFSTFLGLRLSRGRDFRRSRAGKWQAIAVGDSCLFQIRDNVLIASFPLTASSQFTSVPTLLPTKTLDGSGLKSAVRTEAGTWCLGDRLFLMTDALALWFVQQVEQGTTPWQGFASRADSPDTWRTWVDQQRLDHAMRNDDVTLVMISVED